MLDNEKRFDVFHGQKDGIPKRAHQESSRQNYQEFPKDYQIGEQPLSLQVPTRNNRDSKNSYPLRLKLQLTQELITPQKTHRSAPKLLIKQNLLQPR